jgi:hypothetical protein
MIGIPKEDLLKMRGGGEQNFCDAALDMMIELKDWNISHMPLPTFMALVKRMQFHNEEIKRQSKWSKK